MSTVTEDKTVLDMDQLCFICDKQIMSCLENKIMDDDKSCKFSIKRILKYLKVYPVQQEEQNLKNSGYLDDYSVHLCEVCLDTNDKLLKVFGELEVVKMKISYYLSELHQLLNVKEDHQSDGLEKQHEDYTKLKRQIKDKCSKLRGQTSMYVILPKLDTNVASTFKVGQSTSPPDLQRNHENKTDAEDEYQPEDEEASSTDGHSSEISDDSSNSNSTTERDLRKSNQRKRSKKSNTNPPERTSKKGKCSVCGNHFSNILRHKVSQHPEVLFQSARLPNISMSDFKIYCYHLIDPKSTRLEYKQVKAGHSGITKYKCPYCPKRFHHLRSDELLHIFVEHSDKTLKKLKDLQTSISLQQLKSMPNRKRRSGKITDKINSSKYTCECKRNFSQKSNFEDHCQKFHPDMYFPSSKAENLTAAQFKLYCVHLLKTKTSSPDSHSAKLEYKCIYCSKNFKEKCDRRLRAHLIQYHHEELSDKLLKLQNEVTVQQITSLAKLPTSRLKNQSENPNVSFKLQQLCKIKKKLKAEHNCSTCGIRTTSLRKHEAHHHPEKFLKSFKKSEISMEHFKLYCIHLINNQVKAFSPVNLGKKGKTKYQCPNCSNLYGDTQSCRNHLVLAHVSALSTDLVKLQETIKPEDLVKMVILPKTLDERLGLPKNEILVGPSVTTCSVCGVSLTHRGMVFHMKKCHPIEYLEKYRKFPCKKCGHTFTRHKSLSKHKCGILSAKKNEAKVHNAKNHICGTCKRGFSDNSKLVSHHSIHHIDKLFEKSKSVTLSVEQFKIYCAHMLDIELEDLKKIDRGSKGNVKTTCQYCSDTFLCSQARLHLITKHKDTLKEKLEELQKNKKLEEIKCVRGLNDPANKPTFWTCDDCSAYFTEYFAFSRHLRFYCKFRTKKGDTENGNDEEIGTIRENIGDGFEETQFEATEVFCNQSEAKREYNEEGQSDEDNDMIELDETENLQFNPVVSEVDLSLQIKEDMEEEILPD